MWQRRAGFYAQVADDRLCQHGKDETTPCTWKMLYIDHPRLVYEEAFTSTASKSAGSSLKTYAILENQLGSVKTASLIQQQGPRRSLSSAIVVLSDVMHYQTAHFDIPGALLISLATSEAFKHDFHVSIQHKKVVLQSILSICIIHRLLPSAFRWLYTSSY
jgi:hypothetical protein